MVLVGPLSKCIRILESNTVFFLLLIDLKNSHLPALEPLHPFIQSYQDFNLLSVIMARTNNQSVTQSVGNVLGIQIKISLKWRDFIQLNYMDGLQVSWMDGGLWVGKRKKRRHGIAAKESFAGNLIS